MTRIADYTFQQALGEPAFCYEEQADETDELIAQIQRNMLLGLPCVYAWQEDEEEPFDEFIDRLQQSMMLDMPSEWQQEQEEQTEPEEPIGEFIDQLQQSMLLGLPIVWQEPPDEPVDEFIDQLQQKMLSSSPQLSLHAPENIAQPASIKEIIIEISFYLVLLAAIIILFFSASNATAGSHGIMDFSSMTVLTHNVQDSFALSSLW